MTIKCCILSEKIKPCNNKKSLTSRDSLSYLPIVVCLLVSLFYLTSYIYTPEIVHIQLTIFLMLLNPALLSCLLHLPTMFDTTSFFQLTISLTFNCHFVCLCICVFSSSLKTLLLTILRASYFFIQSLFVRLTQGAIVGSCLFPWFIPSPSLVQKCDFIYHQMRGKHKMLMYSETKTPISNHVLFYVCS